MVFKTILTFAAQKRIPMIKFRKGGNVISSPATPSQPQSVSNTANANAKPKESESKPITNPKKTSAAGPISTAVEYYELHPRFQRRPIDEFECEYINRGGPDKF